MMKERKETWKDLSNPRVPGGDGLQPRLRVRPAGGLDVWGGRPARRRLPGQPAHLAGGAQVRLPPHMPPGRSWGSSPWATSCWPGPMTPVLTGSTRWILCLTTLLKQKLKTITMFPWVIGANLMIFFFKIMIEA